MKVQLSKPYDANGVKFDSIELREPTYADAFMSGIGEPRELQPVPGGVCVMVYPERIDQYAQRLIQSPGYEYIHAISAIDSLRLQNAICGFFQEKPDVSGSGTTSSSGLDGTQSASKE